MLAMKATALPPRRALVRNTALLTAAALAATWGLLSLANGIMWWRARKGTRP